ncbi:uncharacterized protein LOC131207614 [Anopheles bellator]|uniref:uncharacterized protein LOC131207614 n=1 Tax=Anopheles bellator TaxID=139047 RepID=UPI00264A1835|nr:uncharacterized protein LOC131207614 [Anopheles bellator]
MEKSSSGWRVLLFTAVLCAGVVAAQDMTITEELETCSLLDRGKLETVFGSEADEFLGKVTVLFNVAPPKPVQTPRIFANRDPIHYNKIDFREQINLYHNLYQRFHSQQQYKNGVRFLLSASVHRVPYELKEYNFTEFFASVETLADAYNISVYPNPLIENGTFALFGLREFQVYVVDRCARVSYIIEPPWSLIQFSYVKAAVLSTFYDRPCGKCELENYLNSTITDDEKESLSSATESTTSAGCNGTTSCAEDSSESTEVTEEGEVGQSYDSEEDDDESHSNVHRNGVSKNEPDPFVNLTVTGPELELPLRVILPVLHIHVEPSEPSNQAPDNQTLATHRLYHYVVLQSNDSNTHQDHPDGQTEDIELQEVSLENSTSGLNHASANDTESDTIRVEGTDWPVEQLKEILNTSTILYDFQQQRIFERLRRYNLTEQQQYDEVVEVSVANRYAAAVRRRASVKPEQHRNNRRSQLKKHYARLIPWLNWTFGKSLPSSGGVKVKTAN